MKTMHSKKAMMLLAALALSTAAIAQQAKAKKTAYVDGNNTYTFSTTNGIRKEYIETEYDGVDYEIKLLNGKLTELHVDGKLIQPADYGKYSEPIAIIRRHIKEQGERDRAQARRDQEQAKRDQEQAKRDQEQAARDQEQAKRDQEQAARDQEQAARDQQEAKRNQEQAVKEQQAAKKDQEKNTKNQVSVQP